MADNERSLAVRIELRDDEQTLNDERIDQCIKQVIESVGRPLVAACVRD